MAHGSAPPIRTTLPKGESMVPKGESQMLKIKLGLLNNIMIEAEFGVQVVRGLWSYRLERYGQHRHFTMRQKGKSKEIIGFLCSFFAFLGELLLNYELTMGLNWLTNRRLGGAQPGNRFVSFVPAYARSGCLVELDLKFRWPAFSLFPLVRA